MCCRLERLPPAVRGGVGRGIGGLSMAASYSFRIPFPPSANTMWRRAGHTIYLSEQGREFRKQVKLSIHEDTGWEFDEVPLFYGRVAVSIELTGPNRRKYDVDNRIKPTLDALMHAGVFLDDEQVDKLIVTRLPIEKPGCCDVTITVLP
jgi:crossover junction endodeoxyribonuclease RusA